MTATYSSRPHADTGMEPWARAALDRGEGLTADMGRALADQLDALRLRMAEQGVATEVEIRYGLRGPDGAVRPVRRTDSRRALLERAAEGLGTPVQWEVHTWASPVSELAP